MASKVDIRLRNKRRRILSTNLHALSKSIKNIITFALLLILAGIVAVTCYHWIKTNSEVELLERGGLYNLVEVEEDRFINVTVGGDQNATRTVVAISDIGVHDLSVFMKQISNFSGENVKIALIDRAGYGFSDDSTSDQTVEQIISDYRTALSKAGISGPYVLLGHRFGGVYATYWAHQYPDEVAGIIYLDGTVLLDDNNVENQVIEAKDYALMALYKLGFQRIVYHDYYESYPKVLTPEEAERSRALNIHNIYSMAYLSELSLMGDNFNKAMQCVEKDDIQKIYVSSANAFTAESEVVNYFKYKNERLESIGESPIYVFTDDEEQLSSDCAEFIRGRNSLYKSETEQFVKTLSNCQLTKMPGDDKIYEHKPNAVIDVIVDFIKYLDGKIDYVDHYYDDDARVDWEKYEEQKRQEEAAATAPSTEVAEQD